MDKELIAKVLESIGANHEKSGGKSGITPVQVSMQLNIDFSSLRDILNHLYENKLIKVREGNNSYLLFKP